MPGKISDSYNSFFPYGDGWLVSGVTYPTWTWASDGYQPVGGNPASTNTQDSKGNDKDNPVLYDIKTQNSFAPFSLFARHKLIDYTGISGVILPGNSTNIIEKNFDNKASRSGLMWSDQEPTYPNIIEAYKDIDAAAYKIQDFIYNKYYGEIPPNYLITLRRYPIACSDIPFTLAYSEATHQQMHTKDVILPIATATTYMSEMAGNKMDDILKFSWGTNWKEYTSEIQTIQSGTPGASEFGLGKYLADKAQSGNHISAGFATVGFNMFASRNYNPQTMGIASQMENTDPWAKYSKFTQGPVDVVMKAKIRDQGLNFTNEFNLRFDYELKSLKYVNPKIAMLDIIANMITMGTNTGSWWGGATRYYGNGGGFGRQPGDLDAFRRGDYAGYAKSLADHAINQIETANGGGLPSSLGEWVNLAKNLLKGAFGNMLGSMINNNLGKLGFTQPANALLDDQPTGYWHVVIGNPLNPIVMMGNMVCSNVEMSMGSGLGYDDFPVEVSFNCKLEHARPRDASDIESMFNAGQGRYTRLPYMAEVNSADISNEYKDSLINTIKNIENNRDAGGIGQTVGLNKPAEGTTTTYQKAVSGDGANKFIHEQIDKVLAILR